MAIGFEAFPRRVQPVLDRWVAGELDAAAFLTQAEWQKVWNLPPQLYLPLFEFARIHRIPMFAMNVDRELTRAIAAEGWDAVPGTRKEGVGRPAAPSVGYVEALGAGRRKFSTTQIPVVVFNSDLLEPKTKCCPSG